MRKIRADKIGASRQSTKIVAIWVGGSVCWSCVGVVGSCGVGVVCAWRSAYSVFSMKFRFSGLGT